MFLYEARNSVDNACWVWSTMALVCRNIMVSAITAVCIWLQQGSVSKGVLAWGKWANFNAPNVMGKMYEHRIWLKVKNLPCCTLW